MHSEEQGPVVAVLDDLADDRCRAARTKEVLSPPPSRKG